MWNSLSCPPAHCKLTVKLLCLFSDFCSRQHFSGLYPPHLENPLIATDFLGLFSSKKTVGYCATSIGFGVQQTWQATVCGVVRVRHDLATELLPLKFTLEKEMATHSSILAWRIPWAEGPNELQSRGSQRVGHDWVTNTHTHTCLNSSSPFMGYATMVTYPSSEPQSLDLWTDSQPCRAVAERLV